MTSGWGQGAPEFREIRPGAGFETGAFIERKVGGAVVERIPGTIYPPSLLHDIN